jgi:hypothetical protein
MDKRMQTKIREDLNYTSEDLHFINFIKIPTCMAISIIESSLTIFYS